MTKKIRSDQGGEFENNLKTSMMNIVQLMNSRFLGPLNKIGGRKRKIDHLRNDVHS